MPHSIRLRRWSTAAPPFGGDSSFPADAAHPVGDAAVPLPAFAGLHQAWACDQSLVLEWDAASSALPPLTYRVFLRRSEGEYDWTSPAVETSALRAKLIGLDNDTIYHAVVRAVDGAGRTDENLVEGALAPRQTYPRPFPFRELIHPIDPTSTAGSHSVSLIELRDGTLLASWYHGEGEHSPDVAIWGARREANASAWSTPTILHDTPGLPDGNSILFLDASDKLWLLWALQVDFQWRSAVIHSTTSLDHGLTWSSSEPWLTFAGFLPRTHALTLDNGWIAMPIYYEPLTSSYLVLSKDQGATWETPTVILAFLGIQPAIIQRSDQSLFALMRSGAYPHKAYQARSTDRGQTWGEQQISELDNPGSSLDMVNLVDGHVAVAFNDSTSSRSNLSLGLSYDEGATWPRRRAIEDHPDAPQSCYDYPSLLQDRCGLIHVSYSFNDRKSIAHTVVDEAWLEGP